MPMNRFDYLTCGIYVLNGVFHGDFMIFPDKINQKWCFNGVSFVYSETGEPD